MSTDISAVASNMQTTPAVQQAISQASRNPEPVPKAQAETPSSGVSTSTEVDSRTLATAIDKLNEVAQNQQRDLSFSVDQPTGRTVVKVFDSSSQELIRQIPAEEVLILAERFASGDVGAMMEVVA